MSNNSDLSLCFRTVGTRQAARQIDGVRRPLKKVGDEAERTGKRVRRQGKSFGVFSKGARMLRLAAVGATAAVGGIAAVGIKSGIQLNAQWQGLQTTFKTLLGSSGAAEKYVESLRQVSKGTPFKLTDIAEASQKLLGVGMSADEAAQQMENIRNVALGSGKGIEGVNRITDILSSVAAKGKVSQVEMQRLAVAGVPVQDIMQKHLGLTEEQTAAMGKAGVEAKDFFKALNKGWGAQSKYGKAAANAALDWNNQVANLKKDTEFFLRTATAPLFERLNKVVMPRILSMVNAMSEGFARGGFSGIFAGLDSELKLGGRLVSTMEKVTSTGRAAFDALREVGGATARYLSPPLKIALDVLRELPSPLEVVGKGLRWIADNADAVGGALAVGIGLLAAYSTAMGIATAATALFNLVTKANPVGLVITAIAALVGVLIYAYRNSETFRRHMDNVWAALKRGAGWVKENVLPALQAFGRFIVSDIVPALKQVAAWIGQHVVPTLREIGRVLLEDVWPVFRDVVAWIAKNFWPVLEEVARIVKDILWPVFRDFSKFAIGVTVKIVEKWGEVVRFFVGLPGKFAKIGATLWDGLVSGAKTAVNTVIKGLNKIIDGYNAIPLLPDIGPIGLWGESSGSEGSYTDTRTAAPSLPGTPALEMPSNALLTPPGAAAGARVTSPGLHWVGENGPELRWSDRGDRIMDHRDSAALAGRGQQQPAPIGPEDAPQPLEVYVQVDSETIARAVVKDARKKKARR